MKDILDQTSSYHIYILPRFTDPEIFHVCLNRAFSFLEQGCMPLMEQLR